MALTTDKIKVGDKFYCPNVLNPKCATYGLLVCTKVEVEYEKFCSNPVEYGSLCAHKENFFDLAMVTVHYKNSKGETGVLRYWEEEFNPCSAESEEEVEDIKNKKKLGYSYRDIKQELRRHYGDIFAITHSLHDTATKMQAEIILNLIDVLRYEITKFK